MAVNGSSDNGEKKKTSQKDIEVKEVITDKVLDDHNNNRLIITLLIVISLLSLCFYILFPKVKLDGAKQMTISYNQLYVESGYHAKVLFKDVTNRLKIKGNLNNSKVGEYYIKYYLDFGLFNISKTRTINIVDDISPEIISEDVINICPNEEVPEVEYAANDEYDGDMTAFVLKNYLDDKIVLTVSDKSDNLATKEIVIDRVDRTPPEIKLKGDETVYLRVGAKYNEAGYEAKDNCDGDITSKVVVSGSVENSAGTYKLTYSVSDEGNNQSEVTRTVIVRTANLYNSGSISNGTIYLTFDDGPSEGVTNVILDILKEQGVKATFFVTCGGPDYLIKRIYDEGHTLALHTATHDYSYIYSSVDNYFNDLNRVSTRVKNLTGLDARIIRFPGGSSNTVSRNYKSGIMTTLTGMVLDKGYRYFDWNVSAGDASTARSSSDVYNNVINGLSKSRANVVLMHDTRGITRDALRNIIKTASSQGYSFSRIEMDTYMIRHGVNN